MKFSLSIICPEGKYTRNVPTLLGQLTFKPKLHSKNKGVDKGGGSIGWLYTDYYQILLLMISVTNHSRGYSGTFHLIAANHGCGEW